MDNPLTLEFAALVPAKASVVLYPPVQMTAGSTRSTVGVSPVNPPPSRFPSMAVITPQNCPIVRSPNQAAGIIYNEVGSLRAIGSQSATQFQSAKNFMAGVTLRNSHVASSNVSAGVNLATGGYTAAGQAALQQCQVNPETHFVIWPSDNGRTPNPGIHDSWPYQSTVTKVFGPFSNPVRVGDVPAGNNIYVFGYR